MLREAAVEEDEIDLSHVVMSHYRLSKIRQQDIKLKKNTDDGQLEPGEGLGTAKPKDRKEEFLSQIIARLNDLFITDELTDADLVNYAYTISAKVKENSVVMSQFANNSKEQAMLGDFPSAVVDAILESGKAHDNQKFQL